MKRTAATKMYDLGWVLEPGNAVWVARYNHLLRNIDPLIPVADLPWRAPVFIVGAPCSGTTLLYQLLANHLDIAYINNFIARFWEAPILGAYLSEKIYGIKADGRFTSSLGRTQGAGGVHEFGYFWRRFLSPSGLRNKHAMTAGQRRNLNDSVRGMARIFGRPLVFKNLTCGRFIRSLRETFPKAAFVQVKRDLSENAVSILKARYNGQVDERGWWSRIPKKADGFKRGPLRARVEAVIQELYNEIWEQSKRSRDPLLTVEYEAMCQDPAFVMRRLASDLNLGIRTLPKRTFLPSSHLSNKVRTRFLNVPAKRKGFA